MTARAGADYAATSNINTYYKYSFQTDVKQQFYISILKEWM